MDYDAMYEKAKEEKRTRKINPEFKEFRKQGEVLVGRYLNRGQVEGSLGNPYFQYVFDTKTGPTKFSMGGFADNEIGGQLVENHIYALTYIGTEDIGGGRKVNKFEAQELIEGNN